MSSITETPNGYQIRVHVGDGHYRKRNLPLPHNKRGRHQAELEAAKLQASVDTTGDLLSRPTIGQLANRWHTMASPGWKPNTARLSRYRLDNYIIPAFGDLYADELTSHQVSHWLATLERQDGEPMASSSKKTIKATLSGLLTFGVEQDLLTKNVVLSVRVADPYREPRPTPSRRAIKRTIANTADVRWRTLVQLTAVTGLRRGEICGLRWSDIDGDTLSVNRSVSVKRDVGPPKTKRSRRKMLIGPAIVAQLEELRAARPYHLENSYIFSSSFDGSVPLGPDVVTQWWERNRRDDSLRFHDLRHYAASKMLDAGLSVVQVAQRLGQDPSTTLSVYAHALPAGDRRAADLLDASVI